MKTIKKVMDHQRNILIKEVDFGNKEMNELFQVEKQAFPQEESYKELSEEMKKEIDQLELDYVETRVADGDLEAIGVFFKTDNAKYLFGIGKFSRDGILEKEYTAFGLDQVEANGNYYNFRIGNFVHQAMKRVVIKMIVQTNFEFLTPEKIQEFETEKASIESSTE